MSRSTAKKSWATRVLESLQVLIVDSLWPPYALCLRLLAQPIRIVHVAQAGDKARSCAFSADGQHLAIGLRSGGIKVVEFYPSVAQVRQCSGEWPECANHELQTNAQLARWLLGIRCRVPDKGTRPAG